ncbi:hypothetical protein [Sphingomonas sp. Leaf10]|uniref:hypothetical protein n=1 Tax=Sphingomonas sp. Leaf10 TaxID=1735676 RepID=UPI0006F3CD5E|nr:hypothetical protein [Sphingomonas sp. Leaf10]KQM29991.1 hypothetical protein ASE59_08795 [Sphingomonas sp. Leaf10]
MPERTDQALPLRAALKGMWIGFGIVAAMILFSFSVLAGYSTGRALGEGGASPRGTVSMQ